MIFNNDGQIVESASIKKEELLTSVTLKTGKLAKGEYTILIDPTFEN